MLLQVLFTLGLVGPDSPAHALVVSSDITTNTTWSATDSPVYVSGDRIVSAGVTLTIEAGVEVRMGAGASLTVNGTLVTQGTSTSAVVFRADQATPTAGYWKGVKLASASTLNQLAYTRFEHGGGGGWQGAVRFGDVSAANLRFDHCSILNSASAGLYMDTNFGAADFTNGNVENCAGDGVYMGPNANTCNLSGNIVRNNTGRAYALGANGYATTGVVSGNGYNGIHLLSNPSVTASGTYGIDVRCDGDLTIGAGATVTLGQGVTYQAANNTTLTVQANGSLATIGTADFPVTITPSSGRWRRINFQSGSSGSLSHCILDRGGLSQQEVIYFYNPTSLTVDNCEIKNAAANGTNNYYKPSGVTGTSAGSVTITNNNIHDNAGYGLYLDGTFAVNGATGTSDALKNNRLVNNTLGAYRLRPNVYPDQGAAAISGNGFDGIICKPEVSTTATGKYRLPVRVFEYQAKWVINTGATVTFEHPVTFDHRYQGFDVRGGLTAVGTAGTPITFTPQTGGGDWAGIQFQSDSTGTLTHCALDNVYSTSAAIYFNNPTALSIRNCEVKNAHYNGSSTKCEGIEGYSVGNVTLVDNNIHDNDGYGIVLKGTFTVNATTGASDDLKNNRLVNNGKGAYGIDANIFPDPGTADLSGNGFDGITVDFDSDSTVSGTYAYNLRYGQVWYARPWINIKSPATVTFAPGVRVEFSGTNQYIKVYNGGGLVAEGTAEQRVQFVSTGTHNWQNIEFYAGSTGRLKHCLIDKSGDSYQAVAFTNPASLVIDNCEISNAYNDSLSTDADGIRGSAANPTVSLTNNNIHDNEGFGMVLTGAFAVNPATGTSDDLKNNRLVNNARGAFGMNANIYPDPGTAEVSGNGHNGIVVDFDSDTTVSGTYRYDLRYGQVWYARPWINVKSPATLTLAPGTRVELGTSSYINVYSGAKLAAEGTANQHIVFTGQTRTRGGWKYVSFLSNSEASLKYCDFEFGGSLSTYGMLFMQYPKSVAAENCTVLESKGPCIAGSVTTGTGTSSLVVRNSAIGKSDEEGIDLTVHTNGSFALENCIVQNNTSHGVYLRGASDAVDLVGNTVTGNGGDAFNIDPDMYPTGSTISGNTGFNGTVVDGAYYGNTATRSGTYETDVRFLQGLVVPAGKTVSIAPGKTVRMSGSRSINAYGEFRAEGTAAQPILITSAQATPARGDWQILNAYDGGTIRLAHATVEYGSSNTLHSYTGGTLVADQCIVRESSGDGVLSRGPTTITNTQIYNNTNNGVQFAGGGGSLTGCTIRDNGQAGVYLSDGTGNTISQCAIYNNGGLAIDIYPAGVTANDAGDTDTGANNKQNYPVLTSAYVTPSNTVVSGTLDSQTGTATIDFFANDALHSSGYGPGQTYLGSTTAQLNSVGSFTATLPQVAVGKFITATATLSASTSEFSQGIEAKPAFSFSAATYTAGEGAGTATITVNLSAAYSGATSVDYATSAGTAIAGTDYTAANGTLTFAANETSKSFAVTLGDDALDEEDETVTLTLSNPVNAGLASPTEATLTITDNDDPPTVAFSATAYSLDEGGGSATVTANLSAASGKTVTVKYATSDGTATAGSDYTAASGTLTFAPGETSKTFQVPVADDTLDEEDETVNLALSDPANATLGTPASATLTITDNDEAVSVALSAATYAVDESGGAATITANLSAASGKTVTVNYATSNGTATAGSDYTAATGTLTFAPGETSKTFQVPVADDTLDEEDETVNVALSNPANASAGSPTAGVLTISDNDAAPEVAFSAAGFVADENAAGAAVTVSLSATSARTVTVQYATSDGTATAGSDYTAATGTLTFAPGETSKIFTVALSDDDVDEPDETINLALSNPANATLGTRKNATLTIRDDEGTPTVFFQSTGYQAQESGGSAAITVGLSGASSQAITVDYATSDGTATAGTDYTAASGTLTFAPGETSKTFQVPITNDTLDEPDETVALALSNPANAGSGTPMTAILTIADDDGPVSVAFSSAGYTIGEGDGSATIGVVLSAASGHTVTVDYATSDATATAGSDYTAASGKLTFAPGETSKSFSVPINDDALDEVDETVSLALANPVNATAGSPSQAMLTITNNNGTPSVAFAAAALSVSEGAGSATVTVQLTAPSGKSVTVRYATSDGTAAAGSDYTAASGALTFAPGEMSKSFIVPITNDALDEADETVNLTLSDAININLGGPSEAVLTIVDDDPAPQVSLGAAAYTVREDAGSTTVTVNLSAVSGRTVTVDYATSDGTATAGADYTAASGTLTFAPGETSKTFSIAVPDDDLTEGDETVNLTLSNASNASLGEPKSAVLTIQDIEDDRLILTSVSPATCENFGSVELTVQGRRILEGAQAWLAMSGQSSIGGQGVQLLQGQAAAAYSAYSSLKASFAVGGIKPGKWDVVVRNPDGKEARLGEAVEVTMTRPSFNATTPDQVENVQGPLGIGPYPFTILGEKLLPGSEVTLSRGSTHLVATDVVVSEDGKRIDVKADLLARDPGLWQVKVEHPHAHPAGGTLRLTQATLAITLQTSIPVQRLERWEMMLVRVRNTGDAPARGWVCAIDLSEGCNHKLLAPDNTVWDEGVSDGTPLVFNGPRLDPGREEVWRLYTQVERNVGTGAVWNEKFVGITRGLQPAAAGTTPLEPARQAPRAGRIAPLVVVGIISVVSTGVLWIGGEIMDAASWNQVRRMMDAQFAEATGRRMTDREWRELRDFLEDQMVIFDESPDVRVDLPQALGKKLVEMTAGSAAGVAIKPAQEMSKRFVAELQRGLQKGELSNKALQELLRRQQRGTTRRDVVSSYDPNIKTVAAGDGAFVRPGSALDYTVHFENKEDASAAAQEVIVTDVLDADLDLDTLAFGECGWGPYLLPAPAYPRALSHDVDLRPAQNLVVQIRGTLDRATRTVTWTFQGIDPTTGDLAWPGFLPPNKLGPEGEGFMAYTVRAKGGLAARTDIRNKASIVFDVNEPIVTNEVVNFIDVDAPASRVAALSEETVKSAFTVSWSGEDDASGVARYGIYVAEDDGAFQPWLIGTESKSAQYVGRFGHRYRFYARATDGVGNEEGEKTAAEAETRVGSVPPIPAGVRMVSLPLMPDQADPLQVFGFEGGKWARYDPQAGNYVRSSNDPQGFTGFGTASAVPGKAYWAYFSQEVRPSVSGEPVDFTDAYSIPLKKGWNMIGSPYLASVAWDAEAILVSDPVGGFRSLADSHESVDTFAWGYDGTAKRYFLVCDPGILPGAGGALEPWQGYWVLAYRDCTLILPPPTAPASKTARALRRRAEGDGWAIALQVRGAGGGSEVTVGETHGRAVALPMPPAPPEGGAGGQAAIMRDGARLAVDVRAPAASQEWEIVVPPADGEMTVTWPDLSQLPKRTRLTLVDTATGARRLLRTTADYRFRAAAEPRRLKLVAEANAGPSLLITGLDVVQGRGGRLAASRTVRFQLSRAASYDVEVLSPTGGVVATVARARAAEAGMNLVTWTGPVARGVYLVRVRATTEEGACVQAVRPMVVVE